MIILEGSERDACLLLREELHAKDLAGSLTQEDLAVGYNFRLHILALHNLDPHDHVLDMQEAVIFTKAEHQSGLIRRVRDDA